MPYMVSHLPSIYPSFVSIYGIHTDPMGNEYGWIVMGLSWAIRSLVRCQERDDIEIIMGL